MSLGHKVQQLVEDNDKGATGTAAHWERIRLGDIAKIVNGFPFVSSYFNKSDGTPVLRIRDILNDRTGTYYSGPDEGAPTVKAGDLVVGMDGNFNCRTWSGSEALLNQRVCKINCVKDRYSDRLLGYVLPGYLKLINDHTSAVTVKHLSSRDIEDIPLPLPPRAEQERLASKIDELFSSIDEGERALERVRKLVERYRQSVLKAAVTGELTREWREQHAGELESGEALLTRILEARRTAWETAELAKMTAKKERPADERWKRKYKHPEAIDSSELADLPEGWVWSSIGQVGFVTGGLTKNQGRAEKGLKRPYLRVANVYANRLDLEEIAEIGVNEAELDRVLLKDHDLLVVEGNGSIGQVGRVAIWDGSIEGCVHQNHIIKVRFLSPAMAWYALLWCLSPSGRAFIEEVASSTAGLHTLSITKIEALPIPVPSAGELASIQDQFERMTSLVLSQQADLLQSMRRAAGLRQSVLRSAFLGALVPQEEADEPASVLLARIAAERAAAASEMSAANEGKGKRRFPRE